MNRWCDNTAKLPEMVIEFNKMKQIVSDWFFDTFGCNPTWIRPKGSYKIINVLAQKDTFKISMDIFVAEVNVIDQKYFNYKPLKWGRYVIPEDASVTILRVWMVVTDLTTNKRNQHDILVPVEYKDKHRLLYDMAAIKMCSSVTDCNIDPSKLRDQLEEYSKWMKVKTRLSLQNEVL